MCGKYEMIYGIMVGELIERRLNQFGKNQNAELDVLSHLSVEANLNPTSASLF